MFYQEIHEATFISRHKRFIAYCNLGDKTIIAHVPNTGRCQELLIPGVKVYLEKSSNPARKTQYSLIGVDKAGKLINIDSQAPNKVVKEALENSRLILPGWEKSFQLKSEAAFGSSRIDFRLTQKNKTAWVEVKGVTLEESGIVRFPDAPTQRGLHHIEKLIEAVQIGNEAFLIFVIQMQGVNYFTPNKKTHAEFAQKLQEAKFAGVSILAYDCKISPNSLTLNQEVAIKL